MLHRKYCIRWIIFHAEIFTQNFPRFCQFYDLSYPASSRRFFRTTILLIGRSFTEYFVPLKDTRKRHAVHPVSLIKHLKRFRWYWFNFNTNSNRHAAQLLTLSWFRNTSRNTTILTNNETANIVVVYREGLDRLKPT